MVHQKCMLVLPLKGRFLEERRQENGSCWPLTGSTVTHIFGQKPLFRPKLIRKLTMKIWSCFN